MNSHFIYYYAARATFLNNIKQQRGPGGGHCVTSFVNGPYFTTLCCQSKNLKFVVHIKRESKDIFCWKKERKERNRFVTLRLSDRSKINRKCKFVPNTLCWCCHFYQHLIVLVIFVLLLLKNRTGRVGRVVLGAISNSNRENDFGPRFKSRLIARIINNLSLFK